MKHEIVISSGFGIEAVTKREIKEIFAIEKPLSIDGRTAFFGDASDIARANMFLRTAERVFVKIGQFPARSFDELFENTKAMDWKKYLSKTQKIVVTAKSVKSTLFALSSIQSIAKKAITEKLKSQYSTTFLPEMEKKVNVEFSIKEDIVTVLLDMSGVGLHKRGYRDYVGEAPLKETTAAALLMLSVWNKDRTLVDLFCGSGTIPIEAAMIGQNMPPNLNRTFDFSNFEFLQEGVFEQVREEGLAKVQHNDLKLFGFDIDQRHIDLSRRHARKAGVEHLIHFQRQDFRDFNSKSPYGVIVTNPPYGERLMDDKEVFALYKDLAKKFGSLDKWSMGVITSYYAFEKAFGKRSHKNRKLFNSSLECYFYQYLGERPPQVKVVQEDKQEG